MKKVYRLFVYGTLRQHESNHYLLKESKQVSRQCWTDGILFDTGYGFPAMVQSARKRVYGEVYEITAQELARIDRLEGYEGEGRANHYQRITQVIHTDSATFEAYLYVYAPTTSVEMNEIRFGDWKCNRYLEQDELLYFAYGSCMDQERFLKAGVSDQFKRVVGCGVARNYSLAYTRRAHNGGRADLVESEGEAEGKVYQISRNVLPYLYRREGVNSHIYRPAFIDVMINGRTYKNVLTFLVVNKEEEVAPPTEYVTEILRGAKGFVSNSYYQKLLKDLDVKFEIKLIEEMME